MFNKYEADKVYRDKEGERIKIVRYEFDQGFEGYDLELIDEDNKQLYNLMEEEVDELLE